MVAAWLTQLVLGRAEGRPDTVGEATRALEQAVRWAALTLDYRGTMTAAVCEPGIFRSSAQPFAK
jgi:hypothetical protein